LIDKCFNPACARELLYLRSGRVIRIVTELSDRITVEHYWLCGSCYESHDFVFSESGIVTLGPKNKTFLAQGSQSQIDSLIMLMTDPELALPD
jgi:hypothetical protein